MLSALEGVEEVTTTEEPIIREFNPPNFIDSAFKLVQLIQKRSFRDLLGLGTITGVNSLVDDSVVEAVATYTNLDPNGPVTVKLSLITKLVFA